MSIIETIYVGEFRAFAARRFRPLAAVCIPAVAVSLALAGCGKKADSAATGGAQAGTASGAQTGSGQAASQAKKAMGGPPGGAGQPGAMPEGPPTSVAVERAVRGTISSTYSATATLESYQEADILARVSGVVVKLEAEEGDRVREGSTLLQIEDREHRLRLMQAEAESGRQKTRFERMEKMYSENLVSAEEFEIAKNDLAAAEASQGLVELDLSYTKVAAPFTGTVTRRLVDPGQTVNVGTALFSMADLDRLLAAVHVPAKEFRNIRTEQPVELVLDAGGERLTGRIRLVSPVVDPQSGTVKVTVEVPHHPAGVRPGNFAEVKIVTAQHVDALLVPRAAVISDRGEQIIYVAADSVAQRRVVTLGFQDDERAEVLTGVEAGEEVVIQGQRSLKDGARLRILPPAFADSARSAS